MSDDEDLSDNLADEIIKEKLDDPKLSKLEKLKLVQAEMHKKSGSTAAADSVSELRHIQSDLKRQVAELQDSITEKHELEGYHGSRELEDMIKVTLRQNKRLSDKVNYLLDALIEASKTDNDASYDKALVALTDSEIEQLDTINKIEKMQEEIVKKVDALQTKVENSSSQSDLKKTQQEAMDILNRKIDDLDKKLVTTLPYENQINGLKTEMDGIENEVKNMEALLKSSPERVNADIGLVKDDLSSIKEKLEIMSRKGDGELAGNLDFKLQSIEKRIENVESLTQSGKVEQEEFFRQQIGKIEKDISEMEKVRASINQFTELTPSDKTEIMAIMSDLKVLKDQMGSVKSWIETYPISEAAETTFLKERFMEISDQINEINKPRPKKMLMKHISDLKSDIHDIEKNKSEGMKRIEKEMKDLESSLKDLDRQLESAKKNDVTEEYSELMESVKNLEQKVNSPESADREIKAVESKISQLEKTLKDEIVSKPEHVEELQKKVQETQEIVRDARGKMISPQKVSNIRFLVDDVLSESVPTVTADHNMPEIQRKLEKVHAHAHDSHRKKLVNMLDRLERINRSTLEHERKSLLTTARAEEVKKQTADIIVSETTIMRDYLKRMPIGVELMVNEVARQLNMSPSAVMKGLKNISLGNRNEVTVKGTGFVAWLFGKEPSFVKNRMPQGL